jgi:hypothetical protein
MARRSIHRCGSEESTNAEVHRTLVEAVNQVGSEIIRSYLYKVDVDNAQMLLRCGCKVKCFI